MVHDIVQASGGELTVIHDDEVENNDVERGDEQIEVRASPLPVGEVVFNDAENDAEAPISVAIDKSR